MRMLMVLAVIACGPSASEIRTARLASYNADPNEVFRIAHEVAAESYKIGTLDDEARMLVTDMQWYNPEGGRQSAGAGDVVQVVDRSVQLGLVVEVVNPTEHQVRVVVTPRTFQYQLGSPKPRELAPDDPALPGWVTGRVESLQLEIHKRVQRLLAAHPPSR